MFTRVLPGRPYPLGATWDGIGVNFALFSENAMKVELCLFDSEYSRKRAMVSLTIPIRRFQAVVPTGNESSLAKDFDMVMMVLPGCIEQTAEEYDRLLEQAD